MGGRLCLDMVEIVFARSLPLTDEVEIEEEV